MQQPGSALGCDFLFDLTDLGHGTTHLLALTAPDGAILHDLSVSYLAFLGTAGTGLGARLMSEPGQGAGPRHESRGQDTECLTIHGQLMCLGVMLAVLSGAHFQVFQAVMCRLVAGADTLAHDLQVFIKLVVCVLVACVLLFLRLGHDVPAGHEQSGGSCPHPTQEFSTVHDRLLLHES